MPVYTKEKYKQDCSYWKFISFHIDVHVHVSSRNPWWNKTCLHWKFISFYIDVHLSRNPWCCLSYMNNPKNKIQVNKLIIMQWITCAYMKTKLGPNFMALVPEEFCANYTRKIPCLLEWRILVASTEFCGWQCSRILAWVALVHSWHLNTHQTFFTMTGWYPYMPEACNNRSALTAGMSNTNAVKSLQWGCTMTAHQNEKIFIANGSWVFKL